MSNYTVHPLAELFPLIEGAEFDSLVESIRTEGLLEPIKLLGDQIIDGRNRLRACEVAGITPEYATVNPNDPAAYVAAMNLERRHLDARQRAAIAADMANINLGDYLGNQHGRGGSTDLPHHESISNGKAAAVMGVSEPSVKRARREKREDPERHEAAKRGGNKAVRDLDRQRNTQRAAEPTKATPAAVFWADALQQRYRLLYNAELPHQYRREAITRNGDTRLRTDVFARAGVEYAARMTIDPLGDEALALAKAVYELSAERGDAPKAEEAKEELSLSAQQKLDAAIRRAQSEADFEVMQEYRRRARPVILELKAELDKLRTALGNHNGLMKPSEFKLARGAVHTGSYPAEALELLPERVVKGLNALYQWLQENEMTLVGRQRDPSPTDIPEDTAEILRRAGIYG